MFGLSLNLLHRTYCFCLDAIMYVNQNSDHANKVVIIVVVVVYLNNQTQNIILTIQLNKSNEYIDTFSV